MGHGGANQSVLLQPSKATLLHNLFITLTLEKLGKSFRLGPIWLKFQIYWLGMSNTCW